MDYEKKYNEALKRAKAAIDVAADRDLVKGVATTIFPELAESDEEKIRREIVDFICWAIDRGSITEEQRERSDTWLAYLEKQKEQKSAEYTLQSSWSTTNEQKPMGWKPQAESLEALMYAVEGHWDMIKPTSYLSRRLEDLYEGLVNTYHVDESYLRKLSEVAYTTDDIEELKALKDKIEASMEQKPVDTSDFKTKLAEYLQNNSPKDGKYVISSESILEMAEEELLKRGVVQKPAEWSEEDEETLNYIINVLDRFGFEEYCKSSRDQDVEEERFFYKEIQVLKKLKSLRPQPKVELSEDVKKTLDEVSHILVGLNYKQLAKDYKQAIEKLLSLRPSWKPSEEQIQALEYAVSSIPPNYLKEQEYMMALIGQVIQQLKKLM